MDDGKIQHRGHIATIDISKASFTSDRGTELNFKDTWKFYVAAYELAKLLDFNLGSTFVERRQGIGKDAGRHLVDRRRDDGERSQSKEAGVSRP
jgi:hypothetical protein